MEEEDGFKGRVEKIFGSLSSSQSPSSSLWSLTGDEVERREWNRHKDDPDRDDETPCSSSFDGFLFRNDPITVEARNSRAIRRQLENLGDQEDDGGKDGDREEWDIRSSIGLDCTLDNEEEEDAYDKIAEGRENIGDRLYMKVVNDHGPYLNSHNVLPDSLHGASGDPRADHDAAKIRLKEDEAVAEKPDSYQSRDESMLDEGEPCATLSKDKIKVKPILKRKNDAALKSSKRVRFDPACKDDHEEASEENQDLLAGQSSMGTKTEGDDSISVENGHRVPDYILNPSKYTCYSFDSVTDVNEEFNIQAYMDLIPKSAVEIPKSVTFIPRKKASDVKSVISSSEGKLNQSSQAGSAVGIAAGEVQQDEVCVMQEDEPPVGTVFTNSSDLKPRRRYRSKLVSEDVS